jgi:transcriptional regulator with XRE-family HTH domain
MRGNTGFAERLVALRSKQGLSKSDLARAVGVSPTCVWNWEEGNTSPRPEALSKILRVLATTKEFLERGVSSEINHDKMNPSHSNVAEIVRKAREQIAEVAGLELGQVRIILDYGN